MPYNPSTGVYSLPAIYLAIPGTVIIAAQHNTPLEDLATANNYARPVIAGGTGSSTPAGASAELKFVSYEAQSLSTAEAIQAQVNISAAGTLNTSPAIPSYSTGLALTKSVGDSTNDITIAPGAAASDATEPRLLILASALTKQIDVAWAVGNNNGGLDTGTIANGTYYIWLIQRSDTGVTDALFSLSNSSPMMPTNYDRKRLLGTVGRVGAGANQFPLSYTTVCTGSDFNGTYTAYPDGTLIQTSGAITVGSSTTASGSVFVSGTQTWTYPVDFIATPSVSGAASITTGWVGCNAATSGTNDCLARLITSTSTASSQSIVLTGVGRWR